MNIGILIKPSDIVIILFASLSAFLMPGGLDTMQGKTLLAVSVLTLLGMFGICEEVEGDEDQQ